MSLIPQRGSLVVQVVTILRRELARRKWIAYLPGERFLCDSLQVSRTTLHEALMALERQGIIEVRHGKRTRILRRLRTRTRSGASRIVGALIAEPFHSLRPTALFTITLLDRHLRDAGFELEIHFDARIQTQRPSKRLETLVQEHSAACWVLFSMGIAVQQWFMNRRVAAIVDGHPCDGIILPSIDIHHETVCRHAVGRFLAAGHRRVALLVLKSGLAGDLASEKVFLQTFQASASLGALPRVVHHDGTLESIRNTLRSLREGGNPFTGILISRPKHALAAVGYLIKSGLRVPQDVAVISRDYEDFLSYHVPSIACYEFDQRLYAARLSRLAIELARTGFLPARPTRIIPEFRPGGSFAPTPK